MAILKRWSAVSGALRQRNFALYLWCGAVSLVGMWAQRIGVGWLTWELTHSGTWLGLMAFADLFPSVLITPFAGAIADRVDRRRMSIVTQSLAMVQAVVLAALTLTGLVGVYSLLALTFFLGVVMAFNTGARLAMVPNLMEREYLPSALALDSALFNVSRFLGPALAGVIIAVWGVAAAFIVNAVTFIVFLWALTAIRMLRDEGAGRSAGNLLVEVRDGLGYAFRHPGIGPALMVIAAAAIGVKPYIDLLPGFADAVFGRGAAGLAELSAISGIGAFCAAAYLAQRATTAGLVRLTLAGLCTAGVSLVVFCATDTYWVGLVAITATGGAVVVCGTGTQTLMQSAVEGSVRGRVMSLYGVIFRGGPAVGALAMGSASEIVGLQAALAGGGALCLGALLWLLPRYRRIRDELEVTP